MATKKTVVELYKEILANPTLTDEQKAFIEKRIELTEKKNANRSTEPTPKQKEKMAVNAEIENAILDVMFTGVQYTPGNLIKLLGREDVASPQKITPRLTALTKCGKVVQVTVKGRSMYTLPSTNEVEGE